jgi:hypothetical protein
MRVGKLRKQWVPSREVNIGQNGRKDKQILNRETIIEMMSMHVCECTIGGIKCASVETFESKREQKETINLNGKIKKFKP